MSTACVLCPNTVEMKRDSMGHQEFIFNGHNKGTIIIDTDECSFSICTSPKCHKKLPRYLIQNHISKTTSSVTIVYDSKPYKFPVDKRVINSFPVKLKEMLNGTYKHNYRGVR